MRSHCEVSFWRQVLAWHALTFKVGKQFLSLELGWSRLLGAADGFTSLAVSPKLSSVVAEFAIRVSELLLPETSAIWMKSRVYPSVHLGGSLGSFASFPLLPTLTSAGKEG